MARMFIQDMEEAGVFMGDLDPNHLVEDGREIDPDRLAPILHTVAQFPNIFTDPDRLDDLKQLDLEYRSGFIGADWTAKTAQTLKSAMSECAEHPALSGEIFRGNYNRFALDHFNFYDGKPLPEIGISPYISALIRQDIEFAHTREELDVALQSMHEAITQMGDQIDLPPGVKKEDVLGSFNAAMQDYFQHRDAKTETFSAPAVNGDRFGMPFAHMPAGPDNIKRMQKAREKAMELCAQMESYPTARNRQLGRTYQAKKTAQFSADYRLKDAVDSASKVSEYVEKQNDAVESIRGLWAKMQAEDKGKHKNSLEYQNMYNAVKTAASLANNYNMDDPEKVKAMRDVLDIVQRTAKTYVDARVVGKRKTTSMGIERKNTALALLQVTNPDAFNEIAPKVKDFRESKAKKHTDLKSLISEEKKEARKRAGVTEEREEHRHVRKQREHARHKSQGAKTV
ncbi:MAG: hypothetical protein K6C95_10060 [Lachnospiraceae bacterium]|nr:hypothetical protein [Lachnospiraceae bacterium]